MAAEPVNPPHLAGVLDSAQTPACIQRRFTSSPLLRWPPPLRRPSPWTAHGSPTGLPNLILWALLAPSCALLGRSWTLLGRPWTPLGRILRGLGALPAQFLVQVRRKLHIGHDFHRFCLSLGRFLTDFSISCVRFAYFSMLFRLSAPTRSKKRRPAKNIKKHHRVASKSRFSVCAHASKINRKSFRTRFSSESRYKKLSQRPRTATSGLLGACWTQLGHSWAPQEASRDSLGALLGALGRLLGRSWGALGRSWALLGSSGASTFSRNSQKSAK